MANPVAVPEGAVLQFSYMGYKAQDILVSEKTNFQVTMQVASNTMNDGVKDFNGVEYISIFFN